jgi:hypothetical protein
VRKHLFFYYYWSRTVCNRRGFVEFTLANLGFMANNSSTMAYTKEPETGAFTMTPKVKVEDATIDIAKADSTLRIRPMSAVSPLLGYKYANEESGSFLAPGSGLQETPMMTPPVSGLDVTGDWRGELASGSADTPRSGITYTMAISESDMLASPIYQGHPLGDPSSWPSLFGSDQGGGAGGGGPHGPPFGGAGTGGKMAVTRGRSIQPTAVRMPRSQSASAGIEFEPLVIPENSGGCPPLAVGSLPSSSSGSDMGSSVHSLAKRTSAPTTRKELTGEEKKMQKRARNTLAARRSRARKMERMVDLEQRCAILTAKNHELEIEILRLRLLLAQGKDLQTPQSFRELMMTPGGNNAQ